MLKLKKSFLMICLVSLFLLISQAAAADSDSLGLADSNASSDSIDISDVHADCDSIKVKDISSSDNGFNTNDNNQNEGNANSKISDEDSNANIESDASSSISVDSQTSNHNLDVDSKDNDGDDEEKAIVEEKAKDTTGIVMAGDNYSCGPASLATVLNKLGLNISLSEVSQHTNTNMETGTTMQAMIDTAKYYNFSACGVEIDTSSLKENNIVHLNINGFEHWTVITKVTDTHVFLADSTEGNMNFTIDEFNAFFTGNAIIISKDIQIDLKNSIISSLIRILDKDQCVKISGKGMKRKIIGYRTCYKYGWIQKYGWVLRPVVNGGHVCFSQWKYVKGYYSVWGKIKVLEPIYKYYYVADDSLTSAKYKKK